MKTHFSTEEYENEDSFPNTDWKLPPSCIRQLLDESQTPSQCPIASLETNSSGNDSEVIVERGPPTETTFQQHTKSIIMQQESGTNTGFIESQKKGRTTKSVNLEELSFCEEAGFHSGRSAPNRISAAPKRPRRNKEYSNDIHRT